MFATDAFRTDAMMPTCSSGETRSSSGTGVARKKASGTPLASHAPVDGCDARALSLQACGGACLDAKASSRPTTCGCAPCFSKGACSPQVHHDKNVGSRIGKKEGRTCWCRCNYALTHTTSWCLW